MAKAIIYLFVCSGVFSSSCILLLSSPLCVSVCVFLGMASSYLLKPDNLCTCSSSERVSVVRLRPNDLNLLLVCLLPPNPCFPASVSPLTHQAWSLSSCLVRIDLLEISLPDLPASSWFPEQNRYSLNLTIKYLKTSPLSESEFPLNYVNSILQLGDVKKTQRLLLVCNL